MPWPPMSSALNSVSAGSHTRTTTPRPASQRFDPGRPRVRRGLARRATRVVIGVVVALVTALAGCGGDGTTTTAVPGTTAATTAPAQGSTTATAAPAVARSGSDLFSVYCAGCHGEDGKAKFSPTVVGVDAERVKTMVTDGSGDMKGYGGHLSSEDIQAIVDYVVTLK